MVLNYIGRGSGNDGVWWARVKMKDGSIDDSDIASALNTHAKKHPTLQYLEGVDEAQIIALGYETPDWWMTESEVYAIRARNDASGFYVTRAGTAQQEWNVMSFKR